MPIQKHFRANNQPFNGLDSLECFRIYIERATRWSRLTQELSGDTEFYQHNQFISTFYILHCQIRFQNSPPQTYLNTNTPFKYSSNTPSTHTYLPSWDLISIPSINLHDSSHDCLRSFVRKGSCRALSTTLSTCAQPGKRVEEDDEDIQRTD